VDGSNWLLLVQVVLTALVGLLSWFLKRAIDKLEKTQERLSDLRICLADEYVKKADLGHVHAKLNALDDEFDGMAIRQVRIEERLKQVHAVGAES